MNKKLADKLFGGADDFIKDRKEITIFPTIKCNANCPFCIWNHCGDVGFSAKDEIDLATLKNFLMEAKVMGYDFVPLTGGEVCLYSKFKELIHLLVSLDMKFTFVTNAKTWELYKFIFETPLIRKNFDSLAISLDGNEKLHDEIRGKGSHKKVLEFCKYLKKQKVKFSIKMALGNHNYNQLIPTLKMAKELGCKSFEAFSLESSPPFLLGDPEIKFLYDTIEKNQDLLRGFIDEGFKYSINFFQVEKRIDFCNSFNDRKLTILPNGKVGFCCGAGVAFPEFFIGDIAQDSLHKILLNKREMTKKILNSWTDAIYDPYALQIFMDDKCSVCRWAMNCKKNNGNLRIKYPKEILEKLKILEELKESKFITKRAKE